MTLNESVLAQVSAMLAKLDRPVGQRLADVMRLLAKWRCNVLQGEFVKVSGLTVMAGPFAKMTFLEASAEGCHIPKLLGTYEQPLHPYLETVFTQPYTQVFNIGSAEGYYAVGMALRMPNTQIFAHDTNEYAQKACTDLAERNGVGARVVTGGLFHPHDFVLTEGEKALVVCDIEGGEVELLDPEKAPALKHMDMIVEVHEGMRPGTLKLMTERFGASHTITLVGDAGHRMLSVAPQWLAHRPHLDQLLCLWEWRSSPTPWMVLKAKEAGAAPQKGANAKAKAGSAAKSSAAKSSSAKSSADKSSVDKPKAAPKSGGKKAKAK